MLSLSASAQTLDPVIMTINGKRVTRSEFEYSFNKNNSDGVIDKKTVEEYVPLYDRDGKTVIGTFRIGG